VKKIFRLYRRVIILGSSGYIGSSLKNYLKKRIKVIGIDRNKIDFLKKNSFKKLSSIVKRHDIIINAVAIAPCKNIQDLNKNIIIINNIQKGLKNKKIFKYINISSDAVYPDLKKRITEKITPDPVSIHGLMHFNREKIINLSLDCKIVHVRPTLVYGYGDPHGGYGPNLFYKTVVNDNVIKLFGIGEEIRDHVYIDDLVFLISKIIFKNFKGIINIATGNGITFKQIALDFKKNNRKIKIISLKRTIPIPHNGYRLFNNKLIKKLFPNFKFNSFLKNLNLMIKSYNEKN
jgi:nucleoside-diphosphate-sugar epimerase